MDPETRFRQVFHVAYAPLCRYALHRGVTGPDADDLVAQTLEIAWRRIDDVPAEPLPWLYAVARNLWRNQLRRERRRRELLARFQPARLPGPGEDHHGVLETGMLQAALTSLSDRDQEVLRLVAWDGLSPAEAATVLGCSPLAARSRLHRARNRLAARLGLTDSLQRSAPAEHKHGDSLNSAEVPQ